MSTDLRDALDELHAIVGDDIDPAETLAELRGSDTGLRDTFEHAVTTLSQPAPTPTPMVPATEYDALRAEVARLEAELTVEHYRAQRELLLCLWREIEGDQEGDAPGNYMLESGLIAASRHRDEHIAVIESELEAVSTERDQAIAERDRLARVLAVERGDKSAAPDGWRSPLSNWYRGKNDGEGLFCAVRRTGRGRHKWGVYRDGELVADGVAANALEAMEAADTAADLRREAGGPDKRDI